MLSSEEMISKIAESTGKTQEEIKNKIEEQKKSMPGISEHGVIRLVAKEMGINLFRPEPQELKIGNILPNMRDITFIGKATIVQPPREFQRGDSMGKVQNIFIEDETGKIRMSIWNDDVEKYNIHLGDVLKVEKARIRKDNFGNLEARLGYNGMISKLEKDIDIPVKEPKNSLVGIEDGDEVDVEATLIQLFDRPLVYQFCPQCRTRVIGNICFTHGSIQPDKMLIITGVIDDGNVSMNAVFFRNVAEKLISKNVSEVEEQLKSQSVIDFINSLNVYGKYKFYGQARRNKITNELEIRITNFEKLNNI